MKQGFLIVANASAGTADQERIDAAAAALNATDTAEVAHTEDLEELDAALDRLDGRTLVVAGGDGSMHAAVGSLWRSGTLAEVVIGLVPLGTGNDLATGLEIPDDPVEAAKVCLGASASDLDLITTDRDEVVVNASHAGLGAAAADQSERFKSKLGPLAYPLGAMIAGVRESGWDLSVTLDGNRIHDGGALMIGIANAPSIGGGTRLVPPAIPSDGVLDVIIVSAVTAAARIAFGVALREGLHLDRDDVVHKRGASVTIAGDPVAHDLDGEVTDERTSCTYTLQPAAWRMLLPRDAPVADAG